MYKYIQEAASLAFPIKIPVGNIYIVFAPFWIDKIQEPLNRNDFLNWNVLCIRNLQIPIPFEILTWKMKPNLFK